MALAVLGSAPVHGGAVAAEDRAHIGPPVSLLIRVEPIVPLSEHADIPIAFTVERILEISLPDDGLGGIAFNEVPVEVPWEPQRFDTSNWGLIAAYANSSHVGGAVIAYNTTGLTMLDERSREIAVLWDLRVHPAARGSGVGSMLFRAVEDWCRQRGCGTLKVET